MSTVANREFVKNNLIKEDIENKDIIEVGSLNVNGTVRHFIEEYNPALYIGCDISEGDCVDEICDVYDLVDRYGEERYDIVISCEMMEHVRDWKKAINNMKKILKVGGKIIITTRSPSFHYHEYPNDFWRFTENDFKIIFDDFDILSIGFDAKEDPGIFICAKKKNKELSDLSCIELMPALNIEDFKDDLEKDIFVIGAYTDSIQKQDILRRQVNLLKKSFPEKKVLVVSHYPISEDIQNMVDYYIYDKINIIGESVCHPLIGWYSDSIFDVVYDFPFQTYHSVSIVSSFNNALRFLKGKFERLHYIESDTFIDNNKYIKYVTEIMNRGKKFVGVHSEDKDDDICTNFFSVDIEWMNSNFVDIKTWEKYIDIDYYTGCFTGRGREFIFEDWMARYFETFDMMKKSDIRSNKSDFVIIPDCSHYGPFFHLVISENIDGDIVPILIFPHNLQNNAPKKYNIRVYDKATGIDIFSIDSNRTENVYVKELKKNDMTIVIECNEKIFEERKIYKYTSYKKSLYKNKKDLNIRECIRWFDIPSRNNNFYKEYGDFLNEKKNLMIVAHPDDESIFAGNLLIRDNSWEVIVVTGESNYTRKKELSLVMDSISNRSFKCLNFRDKINESFNEDILSGKLKEIILKKNYEKILTHNPNGEYGHIQHKSLYDIVSKIVPKEKLYVFDYGERLSEEEIEAKEKLLKIYKSQASIGMDFPILPGYKDYIYKEKIVSIKDYVKKDYELVDRNISINKNFIQGAYVEMTSGTGDYDIEFIDADKQEVIYKSDIRKGFWAKASRQYYVNWEIRIHQNGELIYKYNFNPYGKRIYICFDSKSLGDTIAWIPYVDEFRKKHNCNVIVSTFWNDLFKEKYNEIEFVRPGSNVEGLYGQYNIGWYVPYDNNKNPKNMKTIPLQKLCSDILGIEYREIRPKMK